MGQVCRSWRTIVASQQHPPQRPLPWIVVPSVGRLSSSCALCGCDTHGFHVPDDAVAVAARYFGAYDGGWLFLAFDDTYKHALVSLRTGQSIHVPDEVRLRVNLHFLDIDNLTLSWSPRPSLHHRSTNTAPPPPLDTPALRYRGSIETATTSWWYHPWRSYEVADYPRGLEFNDGIYFLDDGRLYNEGLMFMDPTNRHYPCSDSGKWRMVAADAVPRVDNFLPDQGPSNYSPPAWLLP
ncbi:hypothetical protein ABZP36_029088 [Zizania latifolia]